MKIAVLLTCHNRQLKTSNCLLSLGKALKKYNDCHNGENIICLEIFLVDDGCTDGTAEGARLVVDYAPLHVLKGDGNLYWAGGMRFCWREAMKRHPEWDYYLLLNDDTELMNNVFEELLYAERYAVQQYGTEGVISGITCATDDTTKLTYGGDIIVNRFLATTRRLIPTGIPQMCDRTNANILLVPAKVVDKVGIFYEGYQHAIADSDYAQMVRKAGFPVLLTACFCGKCDQDHGSGEELAKKIVKMSLKERINYFKHPLHSTHDYLTNIRRNAPYRLPLVWLGRMLNLYCPKLYYRINGFR